VRRRDFFAGVATGASPVLAGALAYRKRHPVGSRTSYSQQGEDIVLYHVARDLLGARHPTYVDVGAADPIRGNNTYLMYGALGGHGVLVEPNPMFASALRSERPRDTVVEAGIGVAGAGGTADYYLIKDDPLHNTFSSEQVASLQRGKPESVVERVVKMPLLDINQVIAEHLGAAPDVLSTDTEGLDLAILRSLDLGRFRPGCICAETAAMWTPEQNSDITKYLLSVGYVVRGGSTVNTIYVDDRRLPHGQG
jgi:FkbM family methyltransferase